MVFRYGYRCPRECDFLLAVQGHDAEVCERAFEQYDECPNCGSDLEEVYVGEPRIGLLKVSVKGGSL
jgi:transcription initiation factor IIE alpha subunit